MKVKTKKKKAVKSELRNLIEKNFDVFEKNNQFRNEPKDKKFIIEQIEAMSMASNDLMEKNKSITTYHIVNAMFFMYNVALNQMEIETAKKPKEEIAKPEKIKEPVLSYGKDLH